MLFAKRGKEKNYPSSNVFFRVVVFSIFETLSFFPVLFWAEGHACLLIVSYSVTDIHIFRLHSSVITVLLSKGQFCFKSEPIVNVCKGHLMF